MKSERVNFVNPRGINLAARLDLPARHPPRAYVLFAHCFTCSKEFKAAVNIGKALARSGFAVLRFDFTGLGESEGDFAKTNFTTNVEDIIAAAGYLAREHDAPQVLIGHSFGGVAVMEAARSIPAAVAVVTIATPSDPAHVLDHFGDSRAQIENEGRALVQVLGHRVWIERQFITDVLGASLRDTVRDLRKALLILHAPQDEVVSIDHAALLFQGARHPKSFVSLDGADHLLSDRHDAAYVGALIATWVGRYLKPATVSAAGRDDADSVPALHAAAVNYFGPTSA
jgi:putative redox protein